MAKKRSKFLVSDTIAYRLSNQQIAKTKFRTSGFRGKRTALEMIKPQLAEMTLGTKKLLGASEYVGTRKRFIQKKCS